jgi:hypothetical protein
MAALPRVRRGSDDDGPASAEMDGDEDERGAGRRKEIGVRDVGERTGEDEDAVDGRAVGEVGEDVVVYGAAAKKGEASSIDGRLSTDGRRRRVEEGNATVAAECWFEVGRLLEDDPLALDCEPEKSR